MNAARKKFRLLLTSDLSVFFGYLFWIAVPRVGGFILMAALLIFAFASRAAKRIQTDLSLSQRRLRARLTIVGYTFYIIVITLLACLFRTPEALCFAAVGIVVLLCCAYFTQEHICHQQPKA